MHEQSQSHGMMSGAETGHESYVKDPETVPLQITPWKKKYRDDQGAS